jgi:hypothetical protein
LASIAAIPVGLIGTNAADTGHLEAAAIYRDFVDHIQYVGDGSTVFDDDHPSTELDGAQQAFRELRLVVDAVETEDFAQQIRELGDLIAAHETRAFHWHS